MKTIIHALAIILIAFASLSANAQGCLSNNITDTRHGNTLNLHVGPGYSLHTGQIFGFGGVNYEMGLGRNFTLAPFASLYTYTDQYYWGNELNTPRLYKYREVAIPLGLRASYYFDHVFNLANTWDIYGGGAAGYVFDNVKWESAYRGDKNIVPHEKPLFLAAHAGTRYHMTNKIGVFAEVSSVVSAALGLSVKF